MRESVAAVARNGLSPALQADRDVVLAAVAQNGRVLQHASFEIQADPTVVLVAQESLARLRRKRGG
jgi:hypothetical protein